MTDGQSPDETDYWEASVKSCLGERASVLVEAEAEGIARRKAREKTEGEYGFENPTVYHIVRQG